MKRLGRLICILARRLDLADDGFMGKVKIVTRPSPLKSLTAFFGNQGSGKVDSPDLPVWRPASLRLGPEIDAPRRTGNPDCCVHRVAIGAQLNRAPSLGLR